MTILEVRNRKGETLETISLVRTQEGLMEKATGLTHPTPSLEAARASLQQKFSISPTSEEYFGAKVVIPENQNPENYCTGEDGNCSIPYY
ncbi:hypothetical protein K9L16_02100 [Candidatus Pacearchaeota archaeon]|nr:hypothetical protein [Candidatus Pacearchaeota archaeon]